MSNMKTRLHRLRNLPDILRPEYLGYATIELVHADGRITAVDGRMTPIASTTSLMLAEHPLFGSQQHNEPSR